MDAGGISPPTNGRLDTPESQAAELRTFLIADVRGYTAFTHRHGDEKAAKLAARFASVTRVVVVDHGGSVLELRGDEALCVFGSPRQALRAAVALQQRYVDETRWDSELPLPVGIGLDMGEAVQVEEGYRGGALNLAARLCARAKPGEILATAEVTHLARRIDDVSYVPLSPVRLKGLDDPVRPVRVVSEGEDPMRQLAVLGALPPAPLRPRWGPDWLPLPTREHPRLAGAVAITVVALVVAGIAVVSLGTARPSLRALGENVIGAVNASSSRLVGQTPVGADPQAIASGAGFVWVANSGDDTVSRVDPKSRLVTQTVQVGSSPTGIVVGGGVVWVANSASGNVTRIDPASGSVTQTISTGGGPSALTYEGNALWVVDALTARVLRIDPNSARVTASVEVGDHPSAIASDGNQLWIANAGSGTVSQIDARSATVVQTVHVGNDPRGVAVVGDSVWVTNNLDGTVTRIDQRSASVLATVRVGAGPTGVAGSGRNVWVALTDGLALARIDGRSNRVVSVVRTASAPRALALLGNQLYAAAGVNPSLHRGGTFSAQLNTLGFNVTLDPAVGYDPSSFSIQTMLYDGLVGMRRAAGAAGSTVVPDLAVAVPTPSDGGRTYVFRLRAGVLWSTGARVTASDVRRGLERTVAVAVYPHYKQIVGADKCTTGHCDLSRGVVVDDANGLVTIHLTQPDPEFLYKLALEGASAVPTSTPLAGTAQAAIAVARVFPTTGPYVVGSFIKGKHIELVRNAHFREWSHAAQPDGFPDRITIDLVNGTAGGAGQVDWRNVLDQKEIGQLRARVGSRLHMIPSESIDDVFLNTTVPPFNNLKARQAVNYAVDRAAAASNWYVPGTVTCQQIPPTVPGYRPYCPYTTRPDNTGTWHGPDLVRAQQLVRQSGTAGMDVALYAGTDGAPGLQPVIDAMNAIGYHAHIKLISNTVYFDTVYNPRNRVQAGFEGWLADYPAASNFFGPRFTCAARGTLGANAFNLCDAALDARIEHATQLQVTSPGAAREEWAAIDREVVDLAPAVALVNPTDVDVVSARVHHYVRNPVLGPLFDQMWVR